MILLFTVGCLGNYSPPIDEEGQFLERDTRELRTPCNPSIMLGPQEASVVASLGNRSSESIAARDTLVKDL